MIFFNGVPPSSAYLGCGALPGLKRLVGGLHRLLGLCGPAVRHLGQLLSGGRVQNREHRGCRDPAAAQVALSPEQRGGDVQAVMSAEGGLEDGGHLPEEPAAPQRSDGGHTREEETGRGEQQLELLDAAESAEPSASGFSKKLQIPCILESPAKEPD